MAKEQKSDLKFEDLYKRVESGKLDSVYFLNGDEEYLRIEFTRLLRKTLFGEADSGMNVEKIQAAPSSAQKIVDVCSDYSLFSGGRLVIAYDIQRISKIGQELLVSFLEKFPEGNHLVIFGPPSFDRRPKLYKYLTGKTTWSTLRGLDQRSANFWVSRRFKIHGVNADREAISTLVSYVGNSYGALASQIDKLAIALGDREIVTSEDIKQHTTESAEYDVFHFLRLVHKRDRAGSLGALNKLLDKSDGSRTALFWLSQQLTRYYQVIISGNSMDDRGLSYKLGVPPNMVRIIRDESRSYTEEQLESLIDMLARVEISMRFDQIPAGLLLENLVISLTATH